MGRNVKRGLDHRRVSKIREWTQNGEIQDNGGDEDNHDDDDDENDGDDDHHHSGELNPRIHTEW